MEPWLRYAVEFKERLIDQAFSIAGTIEGDGMELELVDSLA
jgi:hypothetical protein